MTAPYEKLKSLLKELLQLDQPDLDFGLYRIMHAKSAEVTQFLERDLLPQVRQALAAHESAEVAEARQALAERVELRQRLGDDPEQDDEVRRLKQKIAAAAAPPEQLEAEIYDHLYGFFRRYYSEGDFLSKRVYKPGVYAIPYEGEEVKLHWANADQYYIKTSEYLRDYAFRLRPDDDANPMRVHFQLVDAVEGEHGNVKPAAGKDRAFVLDAHDFLALQPGEQAEELVIRFEYRPATLADWPADAREGKTKPPTQKELTEIAERSVLGFRVRGSGVSISESGPMGESLPLPPGEGRGEGASPSLSASVGNALRGVPQGGEHAPSPSSAGNGLRAVPPSEGALARWLTELSKPHVKSDGERADYSRLRAHLNRYVARNTFDYFIHKDLGKFLRRELDFFIKNEVLHLDDIESQTAPRVEQYLSKIKIIRRIAGKIIDFLAQLEDFQKKLWLKKKFVVETRYCIALGIIPDEFLPEIVANDAQWAEWEALHSLSALPKGSGELFGGGGGSRSSAFLTYHPTLMVDTRHFSCAFTRRVLNALGDLSQMLDGVAFNCENFQALLSLQAQFRHSIECVYIDPPYNTDASAIDYKNGYKSSSWMTLLNDRLATAKPLLTEAGVLIAAIDDEQQRELSFLLSDQFAAPLLGTICVRSNPSGRPTQAGYSVSHEYLLFAGRSAASCIGRMPPTDDQMARFSQSDESGPFEWRNLRREGSNSDRSARRALYYPIFIKGGAIRVPRMTWSEHTEEWLPDENPSPGEHAVWPDNDESVQKTWRWEWTTVMASLERLAVRPDRSGRDYIYYKRRPHDEGVVSVSSWFDAKYSATEHGTALLKALFGRSPFSYPKSIHAVNDALYVGGASRANSRVMDFFAGSGTTGHAVINLNRKDGGRRKFVLVEMADYFNSVLLPRVKKVAFTPEWNDGKPVRLATAEEAERGPRIFKIIRLESYEDALNNLAEPRRTEAQQRLLDAPEAQGADSVKEQYMLRYLLDVETRGSQSLLNVRAFVDPTAYRLRVKRPGSDESRDVHVDLLETFNWLIGLTVRHIAAPRTFRAELERDGEGRLKIKGRLREVEVSADPHPSPLPEGEGVRRPHPNPLPEREGAVGPHPGARPETEGVWWFRTVTGTTPEGKKTLVIWRKRPGGDTPEGVERDNLVLDEWFTRQGYSSKDSEFELIYVNGGNNLENLKTPDDAWKVRVIEDDFHRLMFATEEG